MVGDWVQLKTYGVSDKFEKTEAYIFVKVAEIGSGLITVEYNNDIKEPYRICENTEIELIPLQRIHLAKNGFKADETDEIFTYQDGYEIRVSFVDGNKELGLEPYIYLNIEFAEKLLSKEIEYVHELQQAMRIMGCDKEIEL